MTMWAQHHHARSDDIQMGSIPEDHDVSRTESFMPATPAPVQVYSSPPHDYSTLPQVYSSPPRSYVSPYTSPSYPPNSSHYHAGNTGSWLVEDGDTPPSPPRRTVSGVSRRSSRRSSLAMLEEMQELRQTVAFLSQRLRELDNERNNSNTTIRAATGHSNGESNGSQNDGDGDESLKSKQFNILHWLQVFTRNFNDQGYKGLRTGVAFKSLTVSGAAEPLQLQNTVGDAILGLPANIMKLLSPGEDRMAPKKILHGFNGLVRSGELLIVLGRPGSGCSTLLKALCGELHGLRIHEKSVIHYKGIPQQEMVEEFRGEMTYNQEVDKHFPHLTVGQTLEFAASCRIPPNRDSGMSPEEYTRHVVEIVMAVCGLSHTKNTKVGNDFIRGVSGGERKRVSIAEMILAGSSLSAWDNSTRGLDSATALKFVQNLRLASDLGGNANAVAIYQASQAIYDQFDKATLLYEGRQIYFGPADAARDFFERQGWYCPQRQTTGDFLTSITNPTERVARQGMEDKVPRTAQEFQQYWRNSPEFKALQAEIFQYEQAARDEGGQKQDAMTQLRLAKKTRQNKHVRPESPYAISLATQIWLTTKRAYLRKWQDKAGTVSAAIMNIAGALIIGSVFYGADNNATTSLAAKGGALFLVVLIHALGAINEINLLYDQRPIVDKHVSYAFYHPSTEAIAGIVSDIPIQIFLAIIHNIIFYFLAGLRREPGPFFLYFLVILITTFVMSALFRTMAAVTRTVSQAMSLAGIAVLALVMYTGYVVAVPQMKPWFGWIRWLNPVFYAFEILIANEFHGREYTCPAVVPSGPGYTNPPGDTWICPVVGAVAGSATVSGDAYMAASYQYYYSHVWRNLGILFGLFFAFLMIYFIASEFSKSAGSTAEVLVFRRGAVPAHMQTKRRTIFDDEAYSQSALPLTQHAEPISSNSHGGVVALEPQTDIFTWRDIVYDVNIKGEPRRLLDHVSGWVKPGTLTALMGVSGAGKTTLLDCLAQRTTMGVITGDMLVNGQPLGASFQRKTGYVQQQDLHLETATVRESLQFSAMLRQPSHISKDEKYAFVEDVIKMLNMEDFADAVVGIPGQGLNVEQRKLLTIGVELAAKPKLLLFLDEPTSGLDSQSSWTICSFLRKLADSGQAVLCTVHQPSALLFQQFDRLLFLAKGGKTVYFGDIGPNSQTLLSYFESQGARPCEAEENPAEYMLEIVNTENGDKWHSAWNSSRERNAVTAELDAIQHQQPNSSWQASRPIKEQDGEFATPFLTQLYLVTHRVFQQYWRMPSYVGAKWGLLVVSGLFIGFSFFQANTSQAGMLNVVFSIFMIATLFTSLVQQIQPLFVTQRALYEVRERPSKAYSWQAFLVANIVVEIPYQIIGGLIVFATVYYPIAGIQSSLRQGMVLLYIIQFFIYISTFAHMTIVVLPNAESAGAIVTLLVMMSLIFCGVLQAPNLLPVFWTFMYRVSPFTYWIGGIVAILLHGRPVNCSSAETAIFNPPSGQTCGEYMATFLASPAVTGNIQNPDDSSACRFCSYTTADQFMAGLNLSWDYRWRNFGLIWAYVVFTVTVTILLYYTLRARKTKRA
ncbi:ABC-2 type transporter-domain-containing protein [Camillea tinctor]|nr:ABC-2 type transporter-domain-containing protein [Camillea tinctor]